MTLKQRNTWVRASEPTVNELEVDENGSQFNVRASKLKSQRRLADHSQFLQDQDSQYRVHSSSEDDQMEFSGVTIKEHPREQEVGQNDKFLGNWDANRQNQIRELGAQRHEMIRNRKNYNVRSAALSSQIYDQMAVPPGLAQPPKSPTSPDNLKGNKNPLNSNNKNSLIIIPQVSFKSQPNSPYLLQIPGKPTKSEITQSASLASLRIPSNPIESSTTSTGGFYNQ